MSLREVRRRDKTKLILVAGVVAAVFMTFLGVMNYYYRSEVDWKEKCGALPIYERAELGCPV